MTVHFNQDDPRCDSLWGIKVCKASDDDKLDLNVTAGETTDWNLHWPEGPNANHYNFMFVRYNLRGKEVRREMTYEEKHRPVFQWNDKGIKRWRKTLNQDSRTISKQKPGTVKLRAYQCRIRGVEPHWEMKSTKYQWQTYVTRLVNTIKSAGLKEVHVMTLATMRYWGPKLMNAKAVGARTTLLIHDSPKPSAAYLKTYMPFVDNTSGSWRW